MTKTHIFKKSLIKSSNLFIEQLLGHLYPFEWYICLTEAPLLIVSDDILDSAKQKHSTIRRIILFWISWLHLYLMITAIKPIWKLQNVPKNFTCRFASLIVTSLLWYTIIDDYFVVDYLGKKPVVSIVYGNNDLILLTDVLSLQCSGNHVFGFWKCCLGKEWVQNLVILTRFSCLVVNHLQVCVDDLVIEPRTKRESFEWSR